MADTTPAYLRGFILPMDLGEKNVWTAQSSFTQQGPRTGDPQALQSSPMRMIATGSQSSNGDLTIVTRGAGSSNQGRFTFTQNNDSPTIEYGRDSFNGISGFEYIYQSGSGALFNHYYTPTTHIDSEESIYLCYYKLDTSSANKAGYTKIKKDGTKTETIVYSQLSFVTQTQKFHPNIVTLQDGSMMFFHIIEDSGKANIRAHRSEDGTSWIEASRETLDTPIDVGTTTGAGVDTYDIQRIRIAQTGGVVLMLIETNINNTSITKRNQLFQYVSIDNGCSFERITTDAQLASESFHSIDLKVRLGSFVVAYCATTTQIQYMVLPNGYSSVHLMRSAEEYVGLGGGDKTTGTNNFMVDGDTSLIVDDDGSSYVFFLNHTYNFYSVLISKLGVVWDTPNAGTYPQYSNVFNTDDLSSTFRAICGAHWLGRAVLVSNLFTSTALDDSLVLTYFGGYSNVNLPKSSYPSGYTDSSRACYFANYLPVDEPSNISGLNVVGTGSDTISNGFLRIESSVTHNSNRYYQFNDLTQGIVVTDNNIYTNQGIIVRATFKVVTGGSVTSGSDNTGIYIGIDNGTSANYAVKIIASTTQFRVFDNVASSTLGTVNIDMTAGIDMYIAIDSTSVNILYRALNTNELRKFEAGPRTGLANGGGSSAGYVVQFGHLNYSTTTTMQTDWQGLHVSSLGGTGSQFAGGFDNPEDLNARLYPPLGRYSYVYDGVKITTTDGPSYENDKFDIKTEYDYPIENVYHAIAPTPRVGWRSESVTSGSVAAQAISIKFDDDIGAANKDNMPNDLMGIHLSNINWILGEILYYDGGWVSLGSISNHLRSSCSVSGRTVRGAASMLEPYYSFNELAGWTCYFLDGGNKYFRKVVSNTEGKFGGTATTTKQAILTVDTAPPQTATTIYLIPPTISILMNMNGKKAQGFKISISAQETYHKDIRIGEMIIGPVVLPGKQYSWGRTISIESGSQTIETQDGIRYSREVKPPTRNFRLAWTDGIDISQLQGAEPLIDFWVSSNQTGAQPIAVQNDAPDLMMGVIRYLQGNVSPMVYLPNITKSTSASGDFRVLQRQTEQALVTLESEITIENVVGDELQTGTGEVFRIASINLREIT